MDYNKVISLVTRYVRRVKQEEINRICDCVNDITESEATEWILNRPAVAEYIAKRELLEIERDYIFYQDR